MPTIGRTLATNGVKSKFLFSHFGGAFNPTVKLPEDTKACMPQSGKKSNSQDTDQEAKWEATAVPGEERAITEEYLKATDKSQFRDPILQMFFLSNRKERGNVKFCLPLSARQQQ